MIVQNFAYVNLFGVPARVGQNEHGVTELHIEVAHRERDGGEYHPTAEGGLPTPEDQDNFAILYWALNWVPKLYEPDPEIHHERSSFWFWHEDLEPVELLFELDEQGVVVQLLNTDSSGGEIHYQRWLSSEQGRQDDPVRNMARFQQARADRNTAINPKPEGMGLIGWLFVIFLVLAVAALGWVVYHASTIP